MACWIGIALNWSTDTTTQGRVPACSLATTGLSVTSQTSPRLGGWLTG